jgi:hypothetical protein
MTTASAFAWRLPPELVPSCHMISRDGERALIGATDGTLLLYDRAGTEIWRYSLKDRIESLSCTDDARLFLAGTWGGEVCACVNEGLVWSKEPGGVIGALAVTGQGERIAASNWAGQLTLYRRDGTPGTPVQLQEAVVALAVHPSGAPIYAALADHTLVVLEPDGSERWRRKLDGRLRYLTALNYDILVATETGLLVWLSDEGHELRAREVVGGVDHVAASRDGLWVAWVDRQARLSFWHPDRDQGFKDFRLPAAADALAVTGQGDGTICSVALASSKIITFNRYRREIETKLPERLRSTSFSGTGTSATAITHDGSSAVFLELLAVKDWLPPPKVIPRLTASDLVKGNLGTVTLDLANDEGCRTAHRVEITIASQFLAQPQSESIPIIRSGETVRITKAIEPTRAGKLPIQITLVYEDELRKRFEDKREEFVKVV